jgi:fructosamine-3-kinase
MQQVIAHILSDVFPKQQCFIRSITPVAGGDINKAYNVLTTDGPFFIKTNSITAPRFFEGEFRGLSRLAQANGLPVPKPYGFGKISTTQYIVMEWLDSGHQHEHTWQALGEGLAALHQHSAKLFGEVPDQYIGTLPQINTSASSWTAFYRDQRIMPLLLDAFSRGLVTNHDIACGERLCHRLATLLPDEPPALLHGDLWSGNFLVQADGYPALIDPAVYYGHREMDIAMTALFGGFNPIFYEAYHAAYPLQKGWQHRLPISQLYPLLVHLLLFGNSYYGRVKAILEEYGH